MLARPRPGERGARVGKFEFGALRRGHPHRGRATGHRAAGSPGASCTPVAAATTRSRPTSGSTSKRGSPSSEARAARPEQRALARAATRPPYLPGYTHLQRAQPVLLAHHLLAHGWACARRRPARSTAAALDVSPLGAGALAGSSLPLDPDGGAPSSGSTADSRTRSTRSATGTSSPRPVALSLLAVHFSRMGEEIVLWASEEFGFIRLADAYATGSSMCRRRRTRTSPSSCGARAAGSSATSPAARDAQGPAARLQPRPPGGQGAAVRRLRPDRPRPAGALRALRAVEYHPERMAALPTRPPPPRPTSPSCLVARGVPFRDAPTLVGALVRDSVERHVPLVEWSSAAACLGGERGRAARTRRHGVAPHDAERRGTGTGRRPVPAVPQGHRRSRRRARRISGGACSPPRGADPLRRGRHATRGVRTRTTSRTATTAADLWFRSLGMGPGRRVGCDGEARRDHVGAGRHDGG